MPSDTRKFKSFAVFDMETANLPALNYNKVGITEISIYGIATENIENANTNDTIPELPRVLHKLTMMINPRMAIVPDAEKATGLDNFMLEDESVFNENAGKTFLNFLNHLQQPVCLVAHNGLGFDFPNIKHVLDKVNLTVPESVHCIDSLRAFHDIDVLREELVKNNETEKENDEEKCHTKSIEKVEEIFDARARNETTPKRPTLSGNAAAVKRKLNATENDKSDDECEEDEKKSRPTSKRSLNFGQSNHLQNSSSTKNISYLLPPGKRWYPPKHLYKLANLYRRTFNQDPKEVHRAEADVLILTQLMLRYGKDFIDYAEEHSIQLKSIKRLA